MSFSPDTAAIHRRAGALAGKVLKGARPADLPVEGPTTFHFAVNLKTAHAKPADEVSRPSARPKSRPGRHARTRT